MWMVCDKNFWKILIWYFVKYHNKYFKNNYFMMSNMSERYTNIYTFVHVYFYSNYSDTAHILWEIISVL